MTAATAYVLIALWPGVGQTSEPALSLATCQLAARQAMAGVGLPLYASGPAVSAQCEGPMTPEAAGFKAGWGCIKGHNCR